MEELLSGELPSIHLLSHLHAIGIRDPFLAQPPNCILSQLIHSKKSNTPDSPKAQFISSASAGGRLQQRIALAKNIYLDLLAKLEEPNLHDIVIPVPRRRRLSLYLYSPETSVEFQYQKLKPKVDLCTNLRQFIVVVADIILRYPYIATIDFALSARHAALAPSGAACSSSYQLFAKSPGNR